MKNGNKLASLFPFLVVSIFQYFTVMKWSIISTTSLCLWLLHLCVYGYLCNLLRSYLNLDQWSTYLQQFHLNFKYKKRSTNHVADCLSRPLVVALTTILNSCVHETSRWPQLYKNDPEFTTIYHMLVDGKQVPNFHLQNALLCYLCHLFFLQASMPSWFGKRTKVKSHDTLV